MVPTRSTPRARISSSKLSAEAGAAEKAIKTMNINKGAKREVFRPLEPTKLSEHGPPAKARRQIKPRRETARPCATVSSIARG